jgi:hypothetical protein
MNSNVWSLERHEANELRHMLARALDGEVFFSVGEMETITNWTPKQVASLVEQMDNPDLVFSSREANFLRQFLYAWRVGVRHQRIDESELQAEVSSALRVKLKKVG